VVQCLGRELCYVTERQRDSINRCRGGSRGEGMEGCAEGKEFLWISVTGAHYSQHEIV
jgi:hypothetical protein